MAPPKDKKKMTKAELKAEKERKKEEARKSAEEKARLEEEERRRLEEEARLAWEAEQARLEAERARIAQEYESLQPFYTWRAGALEKFERDTYAATYWRRYVEPGELPDAGDEPSVNGYLNTMESMSDTDLESVLYTIINIHKIFVGAEDLACIEEQKGNVCNVIKYQHYMTKLYELADMRLEKATAYLLERSHDIWKETGTSFFSAAQDQWKLGLWVNHAKNPRVRQLDFPAICTIINLSKPFVFANVAIRVYHQLTDPLFKSQNSYMSLGGIFKLDIFSLPPLAKSVKGWTFEEVTNMTTSVITVEYPLAGSFTPGGTVPPIGVHFILPLFVIIYGPLEVGYWNSDEQCWKSDGITNISYDVDKRKISFETIVVKPFAVIQNRVQQFPFQSWHFSPISTSEAQFTLTTNLLTLIFEIGSGWCKLVEPQLKECSHLIGKQLAPNVLLKELSKCGLHIQANQDDDKHMKTTLKDAEVEMYTCHDMALVAPACALSSSKWNSYADGETCIFRLLEIPEPKFQPTFDKSKDVKLALFKRKGNALLNLTEFKSKKYKEDFITEYHASLLITLRDYFSSESIQKIERGAPGYTECVRHFFVALRLFSCGARLPGEEPAPETIQPEGIEGKVDEVILGSTETPRKSPEDAIQNGAKVSDAVNSKAEAPAKPPA